MDWKQCTYVWERKREKERENVCVQYTCVSNTRVCLQEGERERECVYVCMCLRECMRMRSFVLSSSLPLCLFLSVSLSHNAHLSCHLGIKVDSSMRVFGCAARLSIHTRVMTHTWMSIAHMCMSHGCTTKLPKHTWVMHGTHGDKSWVRCQTVKTHMSHVPHMEESWVLCIYIYIYIYVCIYI